jgi:hypothetical protein
VELEVTPVSFAINPFSSLQQSWLTSPLSSISQSAHTASGSLAAGAEETIFGCVRAMFATGVGAPNEADTVFATLAAIAAIGCADEPKLAVATAVSLTGSA